MPDLRTRWLDLCADAKPLEIEPAYTRLEAAYKSPPRAYHNLSHIASCLEEFDSVRDQVDSPLELELAIWYHDCIYDFRASDNEERSADMARVELETLGYGPAIIDQAVTFILKTRHGVDPAESHDEKLLVDIDLSILGKSDARFSEFESQIQEEYSWVPEAQFAEKRAEVLSSFANQDRIFTTEWFFERYEQPARKNLGNSIKHLRSLAASAA
jgi:predicted metal-dependent HD superfamily phosphohydrolase